MRDVRMDRERGMSMREQKKKGGGGGKEGNRERRSGLAVGCNNR